MLTSAQEAGIAAKVPELNNLWLAGYAQLSQLSAQYFIGGPATASRKAGLDNDGAAIAELATSGLNNARSGAISYDDWMLTANILKADIANQVAVPDDPGVFAGALNDAAAAANKAGTGVGIGLGLGLLVLLALAFRK